MWQTYTWHGYRGAQGMLVQVKLCWTWKPTWHSTTMRVHHP